MKRLLAEEQNDVNSSLLLAEERTTRKDPLDNLKKYRGGWNISERHYWAPENLLLDSYGVLKVSDFGLSQQVENGMLHTACRTPNYVAPEVLIVKGYNSAASDIWSCGVILFVLMAGYLPFDEANLMGLYRKIEKADYRCPPWFSSDGKKLLAQILDPNPHTRITIPEILENNWFNKCYKRPYFEQEEDVNLDDVDAVFNESKEKSKSRALLALSF